MSIGSSWVMLLVMCGTGVVVPASAKSDTPTSHLSEAFLVDPVQELYEHERNTCGVTSVYHVMRLLGRNVTLAEVAKAIPIRDGITSLADMCSFLDHRGVGYSVVSNVSLPEVVSCLESGRRVAILHTDGGRHFVVALKDRDGALRAIDVKHPYGDESRVILMERFAGVALIAGPAVNRTIIARHASSTGSLALSAICLGVILGFMLPKLYRMVRSVTGKPL